MNSDFFSLPCLRKMKRIIEARNLSEISQTKIFELSVQKRDKILFMLKFLKLYNKTSCSLYFSNTRHFSTAVKPNFYELLGVNETATQAEIKSSFHTKGRYYSLLIFNS